jgi:hypothetical protein
MKILRKLLPVLVLGGLLSAVTVFLGCNGDSAEGIVRNVGLIVEGFYVHPNEGSLLVSQTSGADVSSMNLRQSGDQLEGIDNNQMVFRGTIGQVVDANNASFTLNGKSTSGADATISGTISVEGTQATMRGTWIEPTLFGNVYGQATVPTNAPPSNGGGGNGLTISPTATQTVVGSPRTFTASGGEPPYNWFVENETIGSVVGSGSTGNYTARSAGFNTVVVADNNNNTARASVESIANSGGPTVP